MPHCLIEGSRSLLQLVEGHELVTRVHAAAMGSGLFKEGEVKVRLSLTSTSLSAAVRRISCT